MNRTVSAFVYFFFLNASCMLAQAPIAAAALMIIFCNAKPKKAVAGAVWQSGMVAVVAIYGIATRS